MMKYKCKKIFLILLLLIMFPENIFAYRVDMPYIDTDDSSDSEPGPSTPGPWDEGGTHKTAKIDGYSDKYHCEYNVSIRYNEYLDINAKNINNENLLDGDFFRIPVEKEILAGTPIAVKISEYKSINNVVAEFVAYKVDEISTQTCTYIYCYNVSDYNCKVDGADYRANLTDLKNKCGYDDGQINYIDQANNSGSPSLMCYRKLNAKWHDPHYKEISTCQGNREIRVTEITRESNDYDGQYYAQCRDAALDAVASLVKSELGDSTYKVELNDVNIVNANCNENACETIEGVTDCPNDDPDCITTISKDKIVDMIKNNQSIEILTDKYKVENKKIDVNCIEYNSTFDTQFKYEPKGVCINTKTAKVRYLSKTESSCGDNELSLSLDEDKYWKYFTPLELKTDQDFYISIQNKNQDEGKKNKNQCASAIENEVDYYEYLIPANVDEVGTLDYPEDNETYQEKLDRIKKAKEQVSEGCYIKMVLKIPTIQRFYNEVTSTNNGTAIQKLKGFNFYYRPIDINNPFPNGILENSLWYEWNEADVENPNLSESYQEITYIATDIDTSTVREYNNNYPYTSWSNMSVNGTSGFISNEGIVTRSSNLGTTQIYKLGCGPANSFEYYDEAKTIKNNLYIEGCELR